MYALVLLLPFTLISAGESCHVTAIYTNTVLSTDCQQTIPKWFHSWSLTKSSKIVDSNLLAADDDVDNDNDDDDDFNCFSLNRDEGY